MLPIALNSTNKQIPEDQIVNWLKSADKRALNAIYKQYAMALCGVIKAVVKDDELSRDVFQDAMVKIWQQANRYDDTKGRLYTWMLNICRNTAIDATRSKAFKMASQIQTDENSVSDTNAYESQKPDHIGVPELVNVLPEDQQELVQLVYFKGYTQQEISDELKIPLGTVKTKVRSAVNKLRAHFKQ
ncbi:sigma-70 family RNA polymerase sigma factor [bacterium]|nr:sigma-70 family RNA polymerase sigma factor [bacterium]